MISDPAVRLYLLVN